MPIREGSEIRGLVSEDKKSLSDSSAWACFNIVVEDSSPGSLGLSQGRKSHIQCFSVSPDFDKSSSGINFWVLSAFTKNTDFYV